MVNPLISEAGVLGITLSGAILAWLGVGAVYLLALDGTRVVRVIREVAALALALVAWPVSVAATARRRAAMRERDENAAYLAGVRAVCDAGRVVAHSHGSHGLLLGPPLTLAEVAVTRGLARATSGAHSAYQQRDPRSAPLMVAAHIEGAEFAAQELRSMFARARDMFDEGEMAFVPLISDMGRLLDSLDGRGALAQNSPASSAKTAREGATA